MRKNFTYLFTGFLGLFLNISISQAQNDTIWPTSDINTIKASQFNGGLNGWTTKGLVSSDPAKKDSAVWVWTATGDADNGAFGSATQKIASPSVANGSVIFDSDFLDNGGTGATGTGKAPTTSASPHSGELVSPIINATGSSNFSIQFNQLYRNFNNRTGACFVTWSEDGGATWKPLIKTNTSIASNGSTSTDSKKLILLPGSIGTANFRIKFVFTGNYYFWILDDVILSKKKVKDMKVSPDFYAIPVTGTHVPKNQLEPIYFLADVINDGNVPMPNVKLTAKVWRISGTTQTEIFTSSRSDYGTIKGDTAVENRDLPNFLAPSALSIGTYLGAYIISSDSSDDVRANDTIYFPFNVTDSLFRRETGANQYYRIGNASYPATAKDRDWQAAQSYYIVSGKKTTLAAVFAPFVGRANNIGKTLFCGIYEFKDANGDGDISKDERTNIVAAGETIITASDTSSVSATIKRINIFDIASNKAFTPKDTTNYLVSLEYDSKDLNDVFFLGFNDELGVDYGAANFAYSQILGKTRYSYFLGTGDAGANVWESEFFGSSTVPAIRMYLYPFLVDTKDILSDKNKFEVYPNPATNSITLDIELENMTSVMLARVLNLQGQVVMEKEVDNFKSGNVQLDVTNLVSGNYMVQIFSKDGTKTKQVVIAK
jgi:Secretion system C-terminal sorting domain